MSNETEDLQNFFLTEFTWEEAQRFIKWVDASEDDKCIYLNTGGGEINTQSVIVDKINEDPDRFYIKMVGNVMSAGLFLILNTKCALEDIGRGDYVAYVYHNGHFAGSFNSMRAHVFYTEALEKTNKHYYDLLYPYFTDTQKKKIDNYNKWVKRIPLLSKFMCDDIYLTLDQIKPLLGDRLVC